ncbi:LuxR C-terminal-related transcriptional regulator [Sphingosinicella sp. BN140058]|uniref:LuxR C-terminal-related transcriptional regulator n=1 Tax=Sphingosinicella sp. BN140058 TaxID=1892855 RepID=UPI0010117D1B|nr:LuxR C-terminal-related transcriptional regulator [Sphingosinicella sp. BN140058]QAY79044.1 PAS domain-containing protein [Sphingosinicella sp. BN140058]
MSGEDEHEALLESIHRSAIATVVTDARQADNPIIGINDAFERLTGYSAAEVIGRNCRFLRGVDSEDEGTVALREAVHAARPVLVELLNYRKDGTAFRNAVMVAPIFAGDGSVRYYIGSQMEVPEAQGLDPRTVRARDHVAKLTPRQQEVLRLMASGLLNKQIAYELGISEKTVKMHRAALLSQLGARSSADAVRLAVEAGI